MLKTRLFFLLTVLLAPGVLANECRPDVQHAARLLSISTDVALPGDFDEDGHLDLLIDDVHYGPLILFNRANVFTPSFVDLSYARRTPTAVLDIDGDGHLDISYPGAYWQRGHGNGEFDPWTPLPFRAGEIDVSQYAPVGDLDHDGGVDFVAFVDAGLQVIRTKDGGYERLPTMRSVTPSEKSAVGGDFDGDGRRDFMIEGIGPPVDGGSSSSLQIFWNLGDFRFDTVTYLRRFVVSAFPQTRVLDVDGDGADEIVHGLQEKIDIVRFQNRLPVSKWLPLPGSSNLFPTAAADLDGDGFRDLVFSVFHRTAGVFWGAGGNQFEGPTLTPLRGKPYVADINTDGVLDLFTADVEVLYGTRGARFPDASRVIIPPIGLGDIAVVDANADGAFDILNVAGGAERGWRAAVMLGDGRGNFAQGSPVSLPRFRDSLHGDFDGDGYLDLLTQRLPPLKSDIRWGDGQGGFGPASELGEATATAIVVLPTAHGSRSDLLLSIGQQYRIASFTSGRQMETREASRDLENVTVVAQGDLDGDQLKDIIVRDEAQNIRVIRQTAGTWQFAESIPSRRDDYPGVKIIDVNADGRNDIVLFRDNVVSVLYRGADGQSLQKDYNLSLAGASFVDFVDFDRDGLPDLLSGVDDTITYYRNAANGAFSLVGKVAFGGRVLGSGDFNGDGRTDLVTRYLTNLQVALGTCSPPRFTVTATTPVVEGNAATLTLRPLVESQFRSDFLGCFVIGHPSSRFTGPYSPVMSSWTTPPLAKGIHRFEVSCPSFARREWEVLPVEVVVTSGQRKHVSKRR